MDRRRFMYAGLAGSSAGLVASADLLAAGRECAGIPAGGLYYTRESPGRWKRKVNSHVPKVKVRRLDGTRLEVTVKTLHSFTGYRHYIVKHVLLDHGFQFIEEHMFDPERDDEARSQYDLHDVKGPLYVLSVCNRHDTWMAMTAT